jgi:hypothetical protein
MQITSYSQRLAAFIVNLIEIAVRDYMGDDEEAERNIDGLVRNELVAFPKHFMRYVDDAYVMQDAATVALGDIFKGVLRHTMSRACARHKDRK